MARIKVLAGRVAEAAAWGAAACMALAAAYAGSAAAAHMGTLIDWR